MTKYTPVYSKKYLTFSSKEMDSAIKEVYFKLQELTKSNQV